jgi:glycine cleavage system aminomethyltransferase T
VLCVSAAAAAAVCSYTGEDGFELSIPNSGMNQIAEALVADPEVSGKPQNLRVVT